MQLTVQLSQQQQQEPNIALVVYSNCMTDDVNELESKLKEMKKTPQCYQIRTEEYASIEVVQFLLGVDFFLGVLILPWYISYDLLEKVTHYNLNHIVFITIEMRPTRLQQLQSEDIFLRIYNLQSTQFGKQGIYGMQRYSIDFIEYNVM